MADDLHPLHSIQISPEHTASKVYAALNDLADDKLSGLNIAYLMQTVAPPEKVAFVKTSKMVPDGGSKAEVYFKDQSFIFLTWDNDGLMIETGVWEKEPSVKH